MQTLEKYNISTEYGFAPQESLLPLEPYFRDWEAVAAQLPKHLAEGTLQAAIESLPFFDSDKLGTLVQRRRAYVLLAFLIHGLVHGCGQTVIRASLAQPFLQLCSTLKVQPVLSYSGLCIFNWTSGGSPDRLGGLQAQFTFTGTLDEEAFYIVPVLVERAGGILVGKLLDAQKAAKNHDWPTVLLSLDLCIDRLSLMTEQLEELKLCDPAVFYHKIRPFIAGLDVNFEGFDGSLSKKKLAGGSAAQSSLLQFLDHLLGIRHLSTLPNDMRSYMPESHRRFLEELECLSIEDLARSGNGIKFIGKKLVECRAGLEKWRTKHISIVTRYIMLPAQAVARAIGAQVDPKGTAGSSPIAFLQQMRNDTRPVPEA